MKKLLFIADTGVSSSLFWYRPPTSVAVSGGASGRQFYVQVLDSGGTTVEQQVEISIPAGTWYINVPGYQQTSTFTFRTSPSPTGGGLFEAYTAGSGSPDQGYSSTLSVTSVTSSPLY